MAQRSMVIRISTNFGQLLQSGTSRFNKSMGPKLKQPLSMVEYSEILARRLQDSDIDLTLYFGEKKRKR